MGHRVEILIGDDSVQSVRGHSFLPGLVLHKAPDCAPGETLFNVSHERSGMAVVTHMEPGAIAQVKAALMALDWTMLPDEFVRSDAHTRAREDAMKATGKTRSLAQEKRLAKSLGGKRQPASGARWGARRDVVLPRFLIEAKTTKATSFSVDLRDLEFLRKQATAAGKTPAYAIQLAGKEEIIILPLYEISDEETRGAEAKTLTKYGAQSFTVTATMQYEATVRNTIFVLETSFGMFVLVSYERFLHLAKKDVDDAD